MNALQKLFQRRQIESLIGGDGNERGDGVPADCRGLVFFCIDPLPIQIPSVLTLGGDLGHARSGQGARILLLGTQGV